MLIIVFIKQKLFEAVEVKVLYFYYVFIPANGLLKWFYGPAKVNNIICLNVTDTIMLNFVRLDNEDWRTPHINPS